MKTHWKEMTNYKYMGAFNLINDDGSYREVHVKIKSIKQEEIVGSNNNKNIKPVAEIEGYKPFIINATNSKRLSKNFGSPFPDDWVGKEITIYVEKGHKSFGEFIDVLRVREQIAKEELTPKHPKWGGALKALKAGSVTIENITEKYNVSEENIKKLEA